MHAPRARAQTPRDLATPIETACNVGVTRAHEISERGRECEKKPTERKERERPGTMSEEKPKVREAVYESVIWGPLC